MRKPADLFATAYEALCLVLNSLRNPLLLAIRLYWGWQFCHRRLGQADPSRPGHGFLHLRSACRPRERRRCWWRWLNSIGGILFAAGHRVAPGVAGAFREHDGGFSERARRPRQFLPYLFQARRLLRGEPLYLLVRGAADPDPRAGFVRDRYAGEPVDAPKEQRLSDRGIIVPISLRVECGARMRIVYVLTYAGRRRNGTAGAGDCRRAWRRADMQSRSWC